MGEEFRLSWLTLVTMLRTVGYVLKDVDAPRNAHLTAAVAAALKELKRTAPKPEIFWGFIQKERVNVVHFYRIGVSRVHGLGTEPQPGHVNLTVDLGSIRTKPGRLTGDQIGTPVPSRIAYGPFKGRNESDVASEAIEWWEQCLNQIEEDAQARATSSSKAK